MIQCLLKFHLKKEIKLDNNTYFQIKINYSLFFSYLFMNHVYLNYYYTLELLPRFHFLIKARSHLVIILKLKQCFIGFSVVFSLLLNLVVNVMVRLNVCK